MTLVVFRLARSIATAPPIDCPYRTCIKQCKHRSTKWKNGTTHYRRVFEKGMRGKVVQTGLWVYLQTLMLIRLGRRRYTCTYLSPKESLLNGHNFGEQSSVLVHRVNYRQALTLYNTSSGHCTASSWQKWRQEEFGDRGFHRCHET